MHCITGASESVALQRCQDHRNVTCYFRLGFSAFSLISCWESYWNVGFQAVYIILHLYIGNQLGKYLVPFIIYHFGCGVFALFPVLLPKETLLGMDQDRRDPRFFCGRTSINSAYFNVKIRMHFLLVHIITLLREDPWDFAWKLQSLVLQAKIDTNELPCAPCGVVWERSSLGSPKSHDWSLFTPLKLPYFRDIPYSGQTHTFF